MFDRKQTVEQFLEATAAKQPTPGGGSVAALAGALAAAMGEMVVAYSVGKKNLEQHAPELSERLKELHHARQMMLELMVEDQAAYEAMTAARKLPKESKERSDALAATAMVCARVPQTMAATAVSILDVADRLVEIVNHFLLSDLAVCADLAMATTRAALYNVRINLPEIQDSALRSRIEKEDAKLLARGLELIQRISPRIWQRVERGPLG